MYKFNVKFHNEFLKELKSLSVSQLEEVHKRIQRIKENPEQFKELRGGNNCFTVRIESMRMVYYFDGANLWFLIIENRKSVYDEYLKRLYNLKMKL